MIIPCSPEMLTYFEDHCAAGFDVPLHEFCAQQVLFYQGHRPYGFFILKSGQVEIYAVRQRRREHGSAPLILGLKPFLKGRPYSITVTTTSRCEVYFVSQRLYQQCVEACPGFSHWLAGARQLQQA